MMYGTGAAGIVTTGAILDHASIPCSMFLKPHSTTYKNFLIPIKKMAFGAYQVTKKSRP